jgi:Mg2+-importing ATPase
MLYDFHVIRTIKIPFLQSRPPWRILLIRLIVMAVGVALPFVGVGRYLGFWALPPLYRPLLAATLLGYVRLTQAVKMWLLHRPWI